MAKSYWLICMLGKRDRGMSMYDHVWVVCPGTVLLLWCMRINGYKKCGVDYNGPKHTCEHMKRWIRQRVSDNLPLLSWSLLLCKAAYSSVPPECSRGLRIRWCVGSPDV